MRESKVKLPENGTNIDVKEVKKLDFLNIDCAIDDLRQLGNYHGNKDKEKTLIGKTTSKHHHRLILLLLHHLKTYPKQVCTSKELAVPR